MIDGSLLLVLATAVSGGATILAGYAATRPHGYTRSLSAARLAMATATALLAVAVIRLGYAFAVSDFAITYVVDHSRRDTAWPIRVAGLWGGMNGSLLLWTAMLGAATVFGVGTGARSQRARLHAGALVISGVIVTGHAAILRWLADPFTTLELPAVNGGGLTPILEHPAMTVHPPILYAGLVGFAPAFAWSLAMLVGGGDEDTGALPDIRRLILWPWTILTAGIALGANWAYAELGWGGYWAWDPVENASFLPWLGGLACLHLARRGDRQLLTRMALVPFVLVAIGSAMTRSGAGSSVHSFADQATIGRSLAVLALLIAGGAVVVLVRSLLRPARGVPSTHQRAALLVAPALASLVLIVVFCGTMYPVIASMVGSGRSVDGAYHAAIAGPAAFVGALAAGLMAMAPASNSSRQQGLLRRVLIGIGGAASGLVISGAARWSLLPTGALVGAAGWLFVLSVVDGTRSGRRWPQVLAHLGFALFLAGVGGSTAAAETTRNLAPGDRFEFTGHEFEFAGLTTNRNADTASVVAEVLVDGEVLRPELVSFPSRGRILAETALRTGYRDDVQLVLVRGDDTGAAVIKVSVRPLVMWIWWGAALMVLGGAAAAHTGLVKRVNAPEDLDPPRASHAFV